MAVLLRIEYDQLVDLVEQLPYEQQKQLIARLLVKQADKRPLTADEKIALLHAAQIDGAVNETPSPRREDWYGDDGR